MKTFQQFSEDIESRRLELRQRQLDQIAAQKQRVADYQTAQKEKKEKYQEREQLKKELAKELQTEQHPPSVPNPYNIAVAKQSALWKGRQIRQSHGEMQSKAQAELRQKQARIKTILSH